MAGGLVGKVSFQGYVSYNDAGSIPVSGAVVELYYPAESLVPITGTTDYNGHYEIWADGADKAYRVVVSDGRTYTEESGVLESGGDLVVVNVKQIYLQAPPPRTTLTGHLYGDTAPIEGALVTLSYGGQYLETRTGPDGYYGFNVEHYGGEALIAATYFSQQVYSVTPEPGSVVSHDFTFPTVYGHVNMQFYTYVDGVRTGPATLFTAYAGETTSTSTETDGSLGFTSTVRGTGQATYWVVYAGRESDRYTITPTAGQSYTHNFYIGSTPVPTTVPATVTPTTAPVIPTATPEPSSGPTATASPPTDTSATLIPTLAPTLEVSPAAVSPTPTPGVSGTGTEATVSPTPLPDTRNPGGLAVSTMTLVAAGIAGLVLIILIIGGAYFLLHRK